MKELVFSAMLLCCVTLNFSCDKEKERTGCKDTSASNFDPQATKDCNGCCIYPTPTTPKGTVLFWAAFDDLVAWGGVLYVKLGNGMTSSINNYYSNPPTNCVNLYGGCFYIDEGVTSYQVFASDGTTKIDDGTINVIGTHCNIQKITP